MTSSNVMEEGSGYCFIRMLMGVMPSARGCQTYLAVVGSWRDLMMSRRPDGWQWRASSLMKCILSELVVSHMWNVLMTNVDSDTRQCRIRARSL